MTAASNLAIRNGMDGETTIAVDLWNEAQSARRGAATTSSGMLELEATRLRSRDAVFLVLEEIGNPIGFALASPAREDWGTGKIIPGLAHISSVAVKPSRWGHGFGRQLMGVLIEELARLGYLNAQLWTQPSNRRALRLYLSLGFWFTGDERKDDLGEHIGRYACNLVNLDSRKRSR